MARKSIQEYAVSGFLAIVAGLSVWILSTVHDHAIQLAVMNEKLDEICHQLNIDTDTAINASPRKPLQ